MTWVERVPGWLLYVVGVSELAGGIGMILPAAARIVPRLTGVTAACLVLVMVLAAGEHVMADELGPIVTNGVLGGMAAFVAWGRLLRTPIPCR